MYYDYSKIMLAQLHTKCIFHDFFVCLVFLIGLRLWKYSLWSFQAGGTKLERFLHKNQHSKRKVLNFEFWINGELSKIGHHFSDKKNSKMILSKNVNNKKW
jgi:hypothetical protein